MSLSIPAGDDRRIPELYVDQQLLRRLGTARDDDT